MATAAIRPVKESDEKMVRFMVAKANMVSLTAANKRAYVHPLVILIYAGLSYLFIDRMGWWPDFRYGWIAILRPLPGMASIFMPLIFIIDWANRPSFEKLAQNAVHAPDMKDFTSYYSRSPASGFWVLEYDGGFVGLIAIDASEEENASNRKKKPVTSKTATIRHFYVQEPYPAAGIQADLLSHALEHCFSASPAVVEQIEATESPLVPYARTALKEAGFISGKRTETVGIFRWKMGICTLQRNIWEKKKA